MRWLSAFFALLLSAGVAQAQIGLPAGQAQLYPHLAAGCTVNVLNCVTDTAAVAVSTVKLRSAYAGSCATIALVSNDATTQTIGFSGNNCDQATASTFCSGSSTTCVLHTWFDQSGNGNNMTCTANGAGRDPLVVFSAVNGLMAFDFSHGSGGSCEVAGITGQSTATIHTVQSCPVATCETFTGNLAAISKSGGLFDIITSTGSPPTSNARQYNGSTVLSTGTKNFSTSGYHILMASYTTLLSRFWFDGSQATDGTAETVTGLVNFWIDSADGGASPNSIVSEGILWNANISDADAKTVCRGEASIFSITTTC